MNISKQQHEQMLRQMLRIRHFEENLYQMYLAKQVPGMSPHLSVGQEAVAVGVCTALEGKDYVLTTHRGHGHVLAKGANMNRMLAEILGKETGYCHGRGGSMHIADVSLNIIGANGIVGGGLPIAVGSALSSVYLNKNAVTVCFFGDAASNIGTFHESLNMAAIWKLPVVWVCENNQYGLSTSIKNTLAGASVANRGSAYGMPGYTVDGNDVLQVYDIAHKAIEHARSGKGPSIIEAKTYRWYGHGASDNRSYRTRNEENEWKVKCPIIRYADYLAREGIVGPAQFDAMEKETQNEVQVAIKFSNESPLPDPDTVCNYIFSETL
jgi:acetoin:2,6-dichlorophenolindophenol oxidoreductase subunit alpha